MLVLGLVEVPWWGILLTLVIGYLTYASRDFNYFRAQGIPGPTPIPILGTLYKMFIEDLVSRDLKNVAKYAHIGCHGEFFGSRAALMVYDEEMLSEILVKKFSAFPNRLVFKTGSTINDNMLTSLKDAHWKYVRNEMTPTFSTGKLKQMNHEINRCAKTLAENMAEQATTSGEVDIKEHMGGFTMDVIASTGFGIRVDSQKDRNNEFVHHARKAFLIKPTNPLLLVQIFFPRLANVLKKMGFSLDLFPKDTVDFFTNITKQTLELRKAEDQSRSDFLQLMIRAQRGDDINDEGDSNNQKQNGTGTGITMDEILANAFIFFIAGYDTTATSLSFFMYNMAVYPDAQEKLYEEIEHVIGDKEFIDTAIIQEMPYLEKCVLENLRLCPPATRINRNCKEDITIKNVFIRKDCIVNLPIYAIHMDPKKWPEPQKFDPERFSPENKKNRSPFHFMPFGYGPRNCIGMRLALQELKVAVIQVLRKVKISRCEKTQVPLKLVNKFTLLSPKENIILKVEPREG